MVRRLPDQPDRLRRPRSLLDPFVVGAHFGYYFDFIHFLEFFGPMLDILDQVHYTDPKRDCAYSQFHVLA